jgi:hypothetical protein
MGMLEVVFLLTACHRGKKEHFSVSWSRHSRFCGTSLFPHFFKGSFALRLRLTLSCLTII